jgi:hypothetical protein
MKKIYNIGFMLLAIIIVACTENPLKEIEGGSWQKERNIVSLLVEGQIGTAVIDREFDDAKVKIFAKLENIEDISKVEIKGLELSFGASTVSAVGSTLDFTTGTANLIVKSGANESLDWQITLLPFKSDLEGVWYIGDVRMYCDMFTWESWGWEKNESIFGYLPELNPELDNTISFTVEGADEKGNPFGVYEHSAGTDGVYGSFSDAGKSWDFNERFRKIPMGTGTWLRDFERNKVIIVDENRIEHELDLELLTETNEVSLKAELPYLASLFSWTDTDWSYEELAHMSNPMWYTLTKERVLQTGNSITKLLVKDQVGDTQIDNDNKEVSVTIANNGADISVIEITDLAFSYAATSDIAIGGMFDFSTNNQATISVTSESGDSATWTIKLTIEAPVVDPNGSVISGTWSIGQVGMYCDLFTWESWGWDKSVSIADYLTSVNPELDNTISFALSGTNGDGNEYGTYENNAGLDNAFGEFVDASKSWDFNSRFRKVPTGAGTWVKVGDVITITVESIDYVLTLETGSDANAISLISEVPYFSELFSWTDTDYNYEELAHMSNKMWYSLSK